MAFEIFLAVVGVFGIWCLFKFTAEAMAETFGSRRVIFWDGKQNIEEILPACLSRTRPVVLLTGESADKESVDKLVKLGIEIYRILEYNVEDK